MIHIWDETPAEIQVDSTGIIENSYKLTDRIADAIRQTFYSIPISERKRMGLANPQRILRAEDRDHVAISHAMPSLENVDLVSYHPKDNINYPFNTLVLVYNLPIDDSRSMDYHAIGYWQEDGIWKHRTKVYVALSEKEREILTNSHPFFKTDSYTIAPEYGVGMTKFDYMDIYFTTRGSVNVWKELGYQAPRFNFDNLGRALWAVTLYKDEVVKLKRYYYPDDPRFEKPYR